jgi:hypothetical protein
MYFQHPSRGKLYAMLKLLKKAGNFLHPYCGKLPVVVVGLPTMPGLFSTPVLQETLTVDPQPLSTPTLRKTSSSFSGISTFQHPSYGERVLCIPTGHSLSTPILWETRAHPSWLSRYASAFQHPFHGKQWFIDVLACLEFFFLSTPFSRET